MIRTRMSQRLSRFIFKDELSRIHLIPTSNIKNSKTYFIALSLYKFILDLSFMFFYKNLYKNPRLAYQFNFFAFIFSWLVTITLIFFLPLAKKKLSQLILQVHFIVTIIPLMSASSFISQHIEFTFYIFSVFLLQLILINAYFAMKKRTKTGNFCSINITEYLYFLNKGLVFVLLGIMLVVYAFVLVNNPPNIYNLLLGNASDARKELVLPSGLLSYFFTWQYRIITPYFIIRSYKEKRQALFYVFIGLQFLLYLCTPYKEILFSLLLILGMLFISKKNLSFVKFFSSVLALSSIFTAICSLLHVQIFYAIVPARLLFEPAVIKFQHFETFKYYEPKLYYSEGLIGKFLGIPYPFDRPSGFVVHSHFFEGNSNSNAGYLAYAYDNLGFCGMILISIAFILVLVLFDEVTKSKNKLLSFVFVIYPFFTLNDGDLFTALLTGGIFLSFLILALDQKTFELKS